MEPSTLNSEATDFVPRQQAVATPSLDTEPEITEIINPSENSKIEAEPPMSFGQSSLNILVKSQYISFRAKEEKWLIYPEISERKNFRGEKYSAVVPQGKALVLTGGLSKGVALSTAVKFEINIDEITSQRVEETLPLARLVEARFSHCSVVYRDIVYVLGGQSTNSAFLNTVEAYRNDKWEIIPPMHKARSTFTAFANQSGLYVAGGYEGVNLIADSFEKYISDSNS